MTDTSREVLIQKLRWAGSVGGNETCTQAADMLEADAQEIERTRKMYEKAHQGRADFRQAFREATEAQQVAVPAKVGDSRFESWYGETKIQQMGTKQRYREAYEAGMNEAQQGLSLDLLERLSKTLVNLGYSTPEGGMEHFGARIESQLYNLCRGVDAILAQQVAVPMTTEEMHDALCLALIGRKCTCSAGPATVDKAWSQFCGGIGRGPDAPYPGMIEAFEVHYGQSFTDKDWRNETGVWAAAWGRAVRQSTPPAQQVAVPAGYVLAPIEPTPEMLGAAMRYDYRNPTDPTWGGIYSVMLAAAQGTKP